MKKLVFLLNLLIVSQLAISQGIVWEPNIDVAFQKAKAANKLVFVECYHPNCPVCNSLEPIFKTKELGDFYNKNFVNYKLNLSDAQQVKFLTERKMYLTGFPLFTYFDANKNLVHISDVGKDAPAKAMNDIAKRALDPNVRGSSYKKRYDEGDRNLEFLMNYAYFSRIKLDTATTIKLGEEIYSVYPKDQLSSQTSWIITQKVIMDVDNGFAQYWFDHMDLAKSYQSPEHPDAEKNAMGMIIQSSLYGKKGQTYSSAQVEKIKEYLGKVGAGQYAAGVTWQQEAKALLREGNPTKAIAVVENMSKQFANNGQALVYLVKFFNDNDSNADYISAAHGWLAQAKTLLKSSKDLAEMNYETAKMYQKAGDKAAAQKAATEAKTLAVSAKVDAKEMKRFNDLVGSLK